jgi:Asp/Glu/hydantoin racemase
MSAASLMEELGVPVVEGVGTPIRMAALLASFGLRPSPRRYPPTHIG